MYHPVIYLSRSILEIIAARIRTSAEVEIGFGENCVGVLGREATGRGVSPPLVRASGRIAVAGAVGLGPVGGVAARGAGGPNWGGRAAEPFLSAPCSNLAQVADSEGLIYHCVLLCVVAKHIGCGESPALARFREHLKAHERRSAADRRGWAPSGCCWLQPSGKLRAAGRDRRRLGPRSPPFLLPGTNG